MLLHSEALLSAAIKACAESIIIQDLDGNILVGSQGIAELYRCGVDDLPGRNAYQWLPAQVHQQVQLSDAQVIETGESTSTQEIWDFSYEQRTMLVTRSPIRDAHGEIVGLIAGYKNISPITQAFQLFEQNQKRFTALARTCPVGIFECNPEQLLTFVNPAWELITGRLSVEAEGKSWLKFIHADDRGLVREAIRKLDHESVSQRVDCRIPGPNKSECVVELSISRVIDDHGILVSYIGSIVDLTFRLAAQKELRENANRLRDLTRSVPAIIWQIDKDGEAIFVSDHWEAITGTPTEQAMGRGWMERLHREDMHRSSTQIAQFIGQRISGQLEYRILGRDKTWRWMLATFSPIEDSRADFIGLAGHSLEITERRNAEIQLQQHNELLERSVQERTIELSKANDSLRSEIESRQQAQELLEEKQSQLAHFSRLSIMGKLSGELAHELNQPLNAIQNYVASLSLILPKEAINAATKDVLSNLAKEVSRASKIIRHTRDFVAAGRYQPQMLDLNVLLQDTVLLLKGEARRRGMSIEIVSNEQPMKCMVDPVRLQQVIVNLILNGLDSMVGLPESDKIVRLLLNETGDRCILECQDSGCGIKQANENRLFEAFFTTKSHGLGMGLSISRSIVEDHGGTLTYAPRAPQGSSFMIRLPKPGA